MTKKYMSSWVFETGVTTIAKLHLTTNKPVEELARILWNEGYQRTIKDDGVVPDMTSAVSQALEWLRKMQAKDLPDFLHHLQWYCACFDDDGKYKRKKLLDGLWFQKSIQDPQRVEHFMEKLTRYYIGLVAGLRNFPPAPDGWSLHNRGIYNEEVRSLTNF